MHSHSTPPAPCELSSSQQPYFIVCWASSLFEQDRRKTFATYAWDPPAGKFSTTKGIYVECSCTLAGVTLGRLCWPKGRASFLHPKYRIHHTGMTRGGPQSTSVTVKILLQCIAMYPLLHLTSCDRVQERKEESCMTSGTSLVSLQDLTVEAQQQCYLRRATSGDDETINARTAFFSTSSTSFLLLSPHEYNNLLHYI